MFPSKKVSVFVTTPRESQRFGVISHKYCEPAYPQTPHQTGVNSTNTSKKRTNMVSSQPKHSKKLKHRRPENGGNEGMCITTQRRGMNTFTHTQWWECLRLIYTPRWIFWSVHDGSFGRCALIPCSTNACHKLPSAKL